MRLARSRVWFGGSMFATAVAVYQGAKQGKSVLDAWTADSQNVLDVTNPVAPPAVTLVPSKDQWIWEDGRWKYRVMGGETIGQVAAAYWRPEPTNGDFMYNARFIWRAQPPTWQNQLVAWGQSAAPQQVRETQSWIGHSVVGPNQNRHFWGPLPAGLRIEATQAMVNAARNMGLIPPSDPISLARPQTSNDQGGSMPLLANLRTSSIMTATASSILRGGSPISSSAVGGMGTSLRSRRLTSAAMQWLAAVVPAINHLNPSSVQLAMSPQNASGQAAGVVGNTYVVEEGDYPVKIAQKVVGDQNRWKELVNANCPPKTKGSDGNFKTLFAGEVLVLPASWVPSNTVPGTTVPGTTVPGGSPPGFTIPGTDWTIPIPGSTPPGGTGGGTTPGTGQPTTPALPTYPAGSMLQAQMMLAAWCKQNPGVSPVTPEYGQVSDLTGQSDLRFSFALGAFQKWSNQTRGTSLRTDGGLDQPTYDALSSWFAGAVSLPVPGTTTPGTTTPGSTLPGIIGGLIPPGTSVPGTTPGGTTVVPGTTPGPATPGTTTPATSSSKSSGSGGLIAAAIAAFLFFK